MRKKKIWELGSGRLELMPDYGNMPVDPSFVKLVQSSPTMVAEQGESFLKDWGGPEGYGLYSTLDVSERRVFAAITGGAGDEDQIEIETGLDRVEIQRAISNLKSRGLINKV